MIMAAMQKKSFAQAEETRSFDRGKVELVKLGGVTFGRGTFAPGWKWSTCVKPLVKTPSCEAPHLQYHVAGRLHVHRARLDMALAGERCVQLTARTRNGGLLALDVDHVINATGLEMRVQAMRNPLLDQLLGDGHACAGAHGIGLATDREGRMLDAAGDAQDDLRVIGSLRVGESWESIAIPELRVQAEAVARDWLGDDPAAPPA